ncbi:hypothetical protein Cni_G08605 [Canna indica]|uniref:Neprosin PEP catalytic domain-containing protein n=1 Tax=Canna indica TaxID=4628 RepID=A0AAQ3Q6Y8_9LILI|nr:hypothetical protein Cni_G08605 [Canna indica]
MEVKDQVSLQRRGVELRKNGFCSRNDRRVVSEESSESSSIGGESLSSPSTCSEEESKPGEEEVESKQKHGSFQSLDTLEESLPIKRGLSCFFSGKSKSFTTLSDVANMTANDLKKQENPFNKRRRILIPSKARRPSYNPLMSTSLPPLSPGHISEEEDHEEEENQKETGKNHGELTFLPHLGTSGNKMNTSFRSNRATSSPWSTWLSSSSIAAPASASSATPSTLPALPPPGWEGFLKEIVESEATTDGVVINSFDDLERVYVDCYSGNMEGKKVWTLGPLSLVHKDSDNKAARGNGVSIVGGEEHRVIRWLDEKPARSVIYLSFGSIVRHDAAQLMEISHGLEAAGRPFLWVIKEAETSSQEVEKWLSGFEERTAGRGIVVKGWAPQAAILAHMAVGGFMTPHLLLVLTLIIVGASAGLSNAARNTSTMTSKELKMIRARLRSLNKPPLKSIQSPDGDIIDCVPFHLQPAFDHPMLKGLKAPLHPPEMPKGNESAPVHMANDAVQLWTISGETCPEGTVAIRRTKEEDILRAPSVERFGKNPAGNAGILDSTQSREHSIVYVKEHKYRGARAIINVWKPLVIPSDLFSLAHIWIMSLDHTSVIEMGWLVRPELYGDDSPRLTIHWTTDNYQKTGCYNLLCPGFVQTSQKVGLGTTFTEISSYDGEQFEVRLAVIRKDDGNWWFMYDGEGIGYWPPSIFTTSLAEHADEVQFGGMVVSNVEPGGSHTTTQMGSGHFGSEGFKRAAFFRNLGVITSEAIFEPVDKVRLLAEKPNCYDVQSGSTSEDWEYHFYYGGPGKNERCP